MVSVVPLRKREQLQHLIFLAGEMHALAAHFNRLGIKVDQQFTGEDNRLGMALGAAHHRVDAGNELILVERLGHVVISAEAQALDLVFNAGEAGEDENGCSDLRHAERFQNFIARHVGQIEVEEDNVVVIELAKVHAFFAEIGGVNIEAFGLQHQLDTLGRCGVVLDQQYSHLESPFVSAP